MERFKRVVVGACAVLLAAGAQAALLDRDLDGDTVVDAFYDTDLDITWLRDANVNGAMDWSSAVSWAENFSIGSYSDWRLPTSDSSCVSPYDCTGSEMVHLRDVELGNAAGSLITNTGNFQHLESTYYWSGTESVSNPGFAWALEMSIGYQLEQYKPYQLLTMAVRDGDVLAVPEPGTYALMLAGLAAFALAKRQRRR